MKQILRISILLLVVLAGVASCGKDEPDGKWDDMKWNVPSALTKENGVYIVPANGGTYTFECKNYTPWIDHCESNFYDMVVSSTTYAYSEWFEVIVEGKNVIITFQPLEDDTEARQLTVVVTAGDIFDSFKFTQRQ